MPPLRGTRGCLFVPAISAGPVPEGVVWQVGTDPTLGPGTATTNRRRRCCPLFGPALVEEPCVGHRRITFRTKRRASDPGLVAVLGRRGKRGPQESHNADAPKHRSLHLPSYDAFSRRIQRFGCRDHLQAHRLTSLSRRVLQTCTLGDHVARAIRAWKSVHNLLWSGP